MHRSWILAALGQSTSVSRRSLRFAPRAAPSILSRCNAYDGRTAHSSGLSLSSTGRLRLNPDHLPLGVGRQSAFRLVQQDEFVAKGIANARTPTDRNIERTLNALAAGAQEERESLVDIGDQNVRLGSDLQVDDKLRVRLGKGEASGFIASLQKPMTELVAIERDRRVKIGDAK